MEINRRPLMGTSNILQLQDNGYKSTVSAISEIIDNSIQANAKNIDVILIRNTTNTSSEVIEEILILDDGDGMDASVFDKALQMSSGTRSNAKNGLGKYGQGLPNASISQAKRVEVYTRAKNNDLLYNYIDLQEIYEHGQPFLPNIEVCETVNIPLLQEKLLTFPDHGTIVRWVLPNKVKPKTAKTLATHIEKLAGRTYRYYIQGFQDNDGAYYHCDINILVFDYNGEKYSENNFLSKEKIKAFDPMFLMSNTQADDLEVQPSSILFETPASKEFSIEYAGNKMKTTVVIKLSYCSRETREKYGRSAGSTQFGKMYLQRNLVGKGNSSYNNISIIRAGREIDVGSFGFITDVSDPRERWWSAEILIDPSIDSIIGIDNKKQQASNISFINDDDESINDIDPIIKWISTYLSANLSSVRKQMNAEDAKSSKSSEPSKPSLPGGGESEPGTPAKPKPTQAELSEAQKALVKWIKDRYPEMTDEEAKQEADYALALKDNYIFIKSDLGDTALYNYNVFGDKVLIEINYMHPFYERLMLKFEKDGDVISSRAIRLLIGALVNANIQVQTQDDNILHDRKRVKTRMAETLEEYINILYKS